MYIFHTESKTARTTDILQEQYDAGCRDRGIFTCKIYMLCTYRSDGEEELYKQFEKGKGVNNNNTEGDRDIQHVVQACGLSTTTGLCFDWHHE